MTLPDAGEYFVGMVFMPKDDNIRQRIEKIVSDVAVSRGHSILAWRTVPVNNYNLGGDALKTEPVVKQFFGTVDPEMIRPMEVEVFSPAPSRPRILSRCLS